MATQDRFWEAYDAWTPEERDPPDNWPFYRAHFGLRAAFGEDFCKAHDNAIHQAACHAHHEPRERIWPTITATLRYVADAKHPAQPYYRYSCYCEPLPPTEQDARAVFIACFKREFPGERANSKHANREWEKLREKALAHVCQRYDAEMKIYQEREAEIDAENAAAKAKWIAECARIDAFKVQVEKLLSE